MTVKLPISSNQILIFVAYLHKNGFAPSSIISYVSAIGYVHRLNNHADPTSCTLVQKVIAGATRIHPPSLQRLPITLVILQRIIMGIDELIYPRYHRLLLKAMFTTAFFGLFRIGEITMSKHKTVPITMSQVTLSQDMVSIRITDFKHNKNNVPVDVPMTKHLYKDICPVFNLSQYLLVRGREQGPLFAFPGMEPVPREYFSQKLRLLISFSGHDVSRYQTHSFRIGGASYFAEMGYTDAQLRLLGRWGSNAFIKYIRNTRATAQQ